MGAKTTLKPIMQACTLYGCRGWKSVANPSTLWSNPIGSEVWPWKPCVQPIRADTTSEQEMNGKERKWFSHVSQLLIVWPFQMPITFRFMSKNVQGNIGIPMRPQNEDTTS